MLLPQDGGHLYVDVEVSADKFLMSAPCGIEVSPVVKSTDVRQCRMSETRITVGYSSKKTIQRNETSGLFEHNDGGLQNGTVSVNELNARTAARQQAINDAHKSDWNAGSTLDHPAYGNAMSRLPKPSDVVIGSKAEHYGSSAEDDTNPAVQGGQPQKTAKVAGIEKPKKRG